MSPPGSERTADTLAPSARAMAARTASFIARARDAGVRANQRPRLRTDPKRVRSPPDPRDRDRAPPHLWETRDRSRGTAGAWRALRRLERARIRLRSSLDPS